MEKMQIFNLNGCVGEGAYGAAEFPSPDDLIKHMDYLGIDRSLVWHVQARDLSPMAGNRKLLETVSGSAETARRLVPAFVGAPANFYEHGAMDFQRAAFKNRGLRALRIFPGTSRFEIRTIERVLGALEEFNPVVLWDFKDSNGASDCAGLEVLALKFPGMAFVLTELMWPQFNDAVDLMWRAGNVYIDTSWLHMREALEFIRDEFGAGRMLFGAGYKSHYGASISALAHASMTEEDRRRIFSSNLEALLGIEAVPEKLAGESAMISEKPFWNRFREGMPVEGLEIIDAHAHTGPHTRGWILRDIEPEENISNLRSQMDSCGVSRTVIVPESGLFSEPAQGNFEVEKMMAGHLDRFMGYFAFNPWYAERLAGVLDDFFSREFFIGFKILPSYWKVPVEDPRYEPVWEYAHGRCLPILIHTWDDRYNSPRMLEKIAPAYPGAFFLLGHSGGGTPGRAEAVALACANPNVYLEFCGSFTTPADWVETIGRAGIGKVIFGSDTGAHSLAWELGRFLSIPLPDEALKPALAENFKNVLRQRNQGGCAARPG